MTEEKTTQAEEIVAEETITDEVIDIEETNEDDVDASKKNKKLYIYAVGRRRTSSAQVKLYKKGEGEITVNNKELKEYFPTEQLQNIIYAPLKVVGQGEKLKIWAKVVGGGTVGQAEAVRHGISRALLEINPNFRKPLRKHGYLTRDPRMKERKKPGLKRARRSPQWAKR